VRLRIFSRFLLRGCAATLLGRPRCQPDANELRLGKDGLRIARLTPRQKAERVLPSWLGERLARVAQRLARVLSAARRRKRACVRRRATGRCTSAPLHLCCPGVHRGWMLPPHGSGMLANEWL